MRLKIESPLARSLIRAWTFDERTGPKVWDFSLNRDSATHTVARFGDKLRCNGTSGNGTTTWKANDMPTRMTVVARAKPTSTPALQYIYDTTQGATGHRIWMDVANANFGSYASGPLAYTASATGVVVAGEWATWAGVHGPSRNELYKNGALIGTSTTYTDDVMLDAVQDMLIGENVGSGLWWTGDIDFILFFTEALGQGSLLRLINLDELFDR